MVTDEEIEQALFSPLDAPFSPYCVSDSSTYIMSPGGDEQTTTVHANKDDEEFDGFIDILDEYEANTGFTDYDQSYDAYGMPQQNHNNDPYMPIIREVSQHKTDIEQPQYSSTIMNQHEEQRNAYLQQVEQNMYHSPPDNPHGNDQYIEAMFTNDSEMKTPSCVPYEQPRDFEADLPLIHTADALPKAPGIRIEFETQFHKKYWRNDRKNLQCFPRCPEYGDYYFLKTKNLKHKASGGAACNGSVSAQLHGVSVSTMGPIVALARINLCKDDGQSTSLHNGLVLSVPQFEDLKKHCLKGKIHVQNNDLVDLLFAANCWKLNVQLSKKRRPKDMPSMAPKYCFEAVCLVQQPDGSYMVLANVVSNTFQIASTRTLAREIGGKEIAVVKQEPGATEATRKRPAAEHYQNEITTLDQIHDGTEATMDDMHKRTRYIGPTNKAATPAGLETIESDGTALKAEPKQPVSDKKSQQEEEEEEEQTEVTIAAPPALAPATDTQTTQDFSVSSEPVHAIVVPETYHRVEAFSVTKAYMWGILGILGGHHYYLERYGWGLLYTCTFGLLTFGWIYDLTRMSALVENANRENTKLTYQDSRALQISPLGILGAHRYALGDCGWGVYYTCTFGCLFVGYIVDFFRIEQLYAQSSGQSTRDPYDKTDMYLRLCPGGIFGAHRFYLGDKKGGILYACTFGLLFVGVIRDAFYMDDLIEKSRQAERAREPQPEAEEDNPEIELGSVQV
mmetsp:Transcript_41146/g.66287  ORF Transcript_41146/g.66287 Transcript_41146/m.66287 type:complete len:734 (+) Transcript_41146:147-2348(+)